MNCRTRMHRRAIVEWSVDGVRGPVSYPPELLDENCQGSVLHAGGAHWLSNIHSSWERAKLGIRRSTDGGHTWAEVREVRRGPAAYSQLIELGSGHRRGEGAREGGAVRLGLLYEGGAWCPYEVIAFATMTFKDLSHQ